MIYGVTNFWFPVKKFRLIATPQTPAGFPLFDWVEQSERPIVGVSIAYRLNLLGFLAGDSLDPEDKNAGLQDQRLALEWVQRHITQFGGDPEQVTIAGESAGGASVVMHMVAFGGTKPALFKRVIAQSIGYGPMATDEQANNAFGVNLFCTAFEL